MPRAVPNAARAPAISRATGSACRVRTWKGAALDRGPEARTRASRPRSTKNLERQFEAAGEGETAGQFLHLGLGVRGDLLLGVVEGSDDQVFQYLDLARVD